LRGNYQFRFIDTFPIDETDTVTIRFTDRGSGAVGVFGGGVSVDSVDGTACAPTCG
jgi:hypothetical protein